MMHGNLTPESIVINAQGGWKLMGFNFCCYSHYQSEAQVRSSSRLDRSLLLLSLPVRGSGEQARPVSAATHCQSEAQVRLSSRLDRSLLLLSLPVWGSGEVV